MLDYFRSNAQSFGVKCIFGLIILVFIGWGVGSFTDRSAGNVVATVNGEPITINDFERAYQMAESEALTRNPSMTREQLVASGLGENVLRDMIQQILLQQAAVRMGLDATPLEMRREVEGIPAFQDKQGRFDPARYEEVLNNRRMGIAAFEQSLANQIRRDKILTILQDAAWTDPAAAKRHYDYLRQKRQVSCLFLPASDAVVEAPSDKEIQEAYEARKQSLAIPRKVAVEFVRVSPEKLVSAASISDDEVRRWYDEHPRSFATPEQVKAAHILVPLAPDADEAAVKKAEETMAAIRKELDGGKSFAAVADAHNGPQAAGPGGELGWVERDKLVKPFADAAFALEPGKISDVVRSQFGLHLIKVEDRKAASREPLDAVKDKIRADIARERGGTRLNEALDGLLEAAILGTPLDKAAVNFNLAAEKTEPLTQAALAQALGMDVAAVAPLMSLAAGMPLDTPLAAGDGYLVCRVAAVEEARTPELAAVRDTLEKTLRNEAALQAVMKKAAEQRATLEKNAQGVKLTGATMDRGGALPGYAPSAAVSDAVFAAEAGQWIPPVAADSETRGQGALLCRVDKTLEPDAAEWNSMQNIMQQIATGQRAQAVFSIFMRDLFKTADIEVLNPAVVTRKAG
ncbi:MAG: SurA N-terminal domain-containing protein [Desulfovibrio sp.]|uniref:SurA N-terminal domain-containing protein n=1 Tax=Desulfovibrio sp. TaxID=885 RepID=UPI0025BD1AAC|nr:SurA N-terminal domain-containing protein [Desulfovibrio sp.]MCI7568489.1 SurA N-terminal domain-containing protein [Desulfovibrio sp.]